jgi:hypothetical protein
MRSIVKSIIRSIDWIYFLVYLWLFSSRRGIRNVSNLACFLGLEFSSLIYSASVVQRLFHSDWFRGSEVPDINYFLTLINHYFCSQFYNYMYTCYLEIIKWTKNSWCLVPRNLGTNQNGIIFELLTPNTYMNQRTHPTCIYNV